MWSASWQFQNISQYFIPKQLPIPTKLTFTPAFITTTMMQNYSQRVICDMPGICLVFFLFAYSYTAFLMVDSFAASPKKKKSFMKQVKPFIFPVTAWLLKSQNCSKHCLSVKHFTSRCKIYQLPNFKHAQKAKFQDSFWVLKWESSLDFHLSLSHLLSSFTLFLAPFFPFCWAFTTLYFGGEVFGKIFRIVGLDARKCGCEYWNKIIGICGSMLHFFLWPPWLNHTHSELVWKLWPFTRKRTLTVSR